MDNRISIEKTKQGFEESFRQGSYYNRQTRDDNHLESILDCIQVEPGMKILDLGTGSGYLAFPFAKKYRQVEVVGLDIVEKTLEENRKKAEKEEISNLHFVAYDGMKFPFEDASFDVIVSRYALHHFPVIYDTFTEISRVLKENGIFFLSDPSPNDDDIERFVDAYMQMKQDGHIQFYTKKEWIEIGKSVNLKFVENYDTSIRFPRKMEKRYEELLSKHKKKVLEGYEVTIIEDEIWITENVNNILFAKGLWTE